MTRFPYVRPLASILLTGALLPSTPAVACGGFFCNNTPIDQAGERIVFALNPDTGKVDTHVQITYEGDAEDFAWVVPVPELPELFLSTDELFTQLDRRTAPSFQLSYSDEGDCGYGSDYGYTWAMDASSSASYADTGVAGGGVDIIATQVVGPYDTVILQASSSAALLTWLQDNNYDLPDTLDPVLAPYVANEAYFVALRLQNDRTAGDIAPLGMRYDGDKAGIPIQLTSIAATPDMRLTVYVFGNHRAVPDSYLHVQINEAAVNWINFGSNYDDVITAAANEAGGQAFATDFAGSTSPFGDVLWWDGRYNPDALRILVDPVDFMTGLINQGYPANDTLLSLLQTHIPMPATVAAMGVSDQDFYNCLQCYADELAGQPFDPNAFADDLDLFVVSPLREAEGLFDHPYLSRLTSSMSPTEMTVDPVFVLNSDMSDVDNLHQADLVWVCGNGLSRWEAPRRLALSDGRVLLLPSDEWLSDHGMTMEDFLATVTDINALIIEKTGANGQPEVLYDYWDEASDDTRESNDRVLDLYADEGDDSHTKGCGCSTSPAGTTSVFWLTILGMTCRRRRKTR